jgi:hypothetical protein
MVYPLTYRRPSHVPSASTNSLSGDEKQDSINESFQSTSSSMSHGIPPALSFDRIIAGGTCPVCIEISDTYGTTYTNYSRSRYETS